MMLKLAQSSPKEVSNFMKYSFIRGPLALSLCLIWLCTITGIAEESLSLEQQLLTAISQKNSELALSAIKRGAKVNVANSKGLPFLNIASYPGLERVVNAMIERGVNPHARDTTGGTAVLLASSQGYVSIVRALTDPDLGLHTELGDNGLVRFERKANVNDQDFVGLTPLMMAVDGQHYDVVNLLVDRGADLNLKAKNGFTALMMAVKGGDKNIVEYLLVKGADKSLKAESGKTALDFAEQDNSTELIALLDQPPAPTLLSKKENATVQSPKPKAESAPAQSPKPKAESAPAQSPKPKAESAPAQSPKPKARGGRTAGFYVNYWTQTRMNVKAGDTVAIEATGRVRFGFWVGSGGPEGIPITDFRIVTEDGFNHGVLMARVKRPGMDDPWYKIGSSGEFVSPYAGEIELRLNDSDPGNNRGQFDVSVTVIPRR